MAKKKPAPRPKVMPLRQQYEARVLYYARCYARMKVFGASIESDVINWFGAVDQETRAKFLLGQLENAARSLALAMSIDEREGKLYD